jgi:UDP-N-acetylmuramate dehydrogenase
VGAAEVSTLHANYIVNTGGATARQVREVIGHVRRTVRERFGVGLELEVKLVGSDGSVSGEP